MCLCDYSFYVLDLFVVSYHVAFPVGISCFPTVQHLGGENAVPIFSIGTTLQVKILHSCCLDLKNPLNQNMIKGSVCCAF